MKEFWVSSTTPTVLLTQLSFDGNQWRYQIHPPISLMDYQLFVVLAAPLCAMDMLFTCNSFLLSLYIILLLLFIWFYGNIRASINGLIVIYRYTANKSMDNCAFCNADGDFLIVPQQGSKYITCFLIVLWKKL